MRRARKRPGPWDADWWDQRPQTARVAVTRERLVRETLALVDEVGFEGLTMRRLAERVGVKAASLYNHVQDKDELLAMAADAICAEVPPPNRRRRWRSRLEELAQGYRRVLLARRDAARVLAATPPLGLHRLELIEAVLDTLCEAGLAGAEVTHVAAAFNSYVVGFVLDETQPAADLRDAAHTAREEIAAGFRSLPSDRFPKLIELAEPLAAHDTERAFRLGLSFFLDGLNARVEGRRRP